MAIREEILKPFNEHFGINTFVRLKRPSIVIILEDGGAGQYDNKENNPLFITSVEEYVDDGHMCVCFVDTDFNSYRTGFFRCFEGFCDFFECI